MESALRRIAHLANALTRNSNTKWTVDSDCFMLILSHLSLTDLANCRRVCSLWRRVASSNQLWEKMYQKYFFEKASQQVWSKIFNPITQLIVDQDVIGMEKVDFDYYWFNRWCYSINKIPKIRSNLEFEEHRSDNFLLILHRNRNSTFTLSDQIDPRFDYKTHKLAAILSL